MTDFCTLYVTTKDKAEATKIARTLVEEKFIACANIMEGATSIYAWDGEVCEEGECVLFLKTRKDMSDAVIARTRALHSYETACIVRWDITGGNAGYLKWLDGRLKPEAPDPDQQ